MPNPTRQKINYTLSEEMLPEQLSIDRSGEFFVARAQQTVWFVASNGVLVSLTDLLQNAKPVAPPRHGRDGKDGESIKGERGERGADGKDGMNGRDGVGLVGANGMHATNGKDGAPGPDTAAVLAEARTELANVRSEFAALKQDFETLSLAFVTANKKNGEYLDFLRERVAQRMGKQ